MPVWSEGERQRRVPFPDRPYPSGYYPCPRKNLTPCGSVRRADVEYDGFAVGECGASSGHAGRLGRGGLRAPETSGVKRRSGM